MTRSAEFLEVQPHELELGTARRICPFCSGPLIVNMPKPDDAMRERESHALKLGFDELTPTERELFDFVYGFFPKAVATVTIMRTLSLSRESVRQHVFRLRAKLAKNGWLLVQQNAAFRLVEPVPIV